jgi:RsiW-degrading membrane proteinase PrsW (M82 family)
VPLANEVTTLGRGTQNDVVLLDPTVSREHARLLRRPDGWWIENRSVSIPLWVDGREVAPGAGAAVPLGATLALGEVRLQLLAANAISGEETLLLPRIALDAAVQRAGGTGILSPGVTLQFALKERLSARALWAIAVAVVLVFAICAVLTLGTAALIGQQTLAVGGLGQVLAAVTIPLVPALGVSLVVGLLDRYEREPFPILLAAFLWGAVIAIPPALFVERGIGAAVLAHIAVPGLGGELARAGAQALDASLTEETIKGAGLALLLWTLRDEFDNVTDGVLYGALIGAGFAMVENYVYFAVSPRGDLGFLIFGRVVLGWLSHSTFTACFGAGLGFAREMARGARRRWLPPLAGFGAGLGLHALFDGVAFGMTALTAHGVVDSSSAPLALGGLLLEYLPLFAAQLYLLRIVLASLDREAEVVRAYLAREVVAGVVTPDEYLLLQNAMWRARAERYYGLTYGVRAYLTARALFQTATGLAFRKWHVAQGDAPKPTPRQPEDAYRARIGRTRRSLLRQVRARQVAAQIRATFNFLGQATGILHGRTRPPHRHG